MPSGVAAELLAVGPRDYRHSSIYGSSVQPNGTQLNALPTLPVLTRGVSGCVNSANLNISQHFTSHLFSPWIPSSARGLDGGP